jgi:4-hydroxythreonine-4-phosphate dehydrogenase
MTGVPRLAVTMGDPAGIGPEILLDGLERLAPRVRAGELALVAIGTRSVLDSVARTGGHRVDFVDGGDAIAWPAVALVEAAAAESAIPIGEVSREAGRLAASAVETAVRLAMNGEVEAIVTGPISKEAINLAGYPFAGHTDMLAHLTGSGRSVMMLAHGPLRVTHVSTHVALEKAPALLTGDRLRLVIDLTFEALGELGIARPRIAVAALNPHAGEGGMFGREDIDITAPVVEQYRRDGHDVVGPVPGDTVFVRAAAGQFDAVVAMYHDQGHIPVKLLGFRVDSKSGRWLGLSGINITLGLPIIRTSVDHGTAFDIAGKGVANSDSLVEAVEFALQLVIGRRNRAAVQADREAV